MPACATTKEKQRERDQRRERRNAENRNSHPLPCHRSTWEMVIEYLGLGDEALNRKAGKKYHQELDAIASLHDLAIAEYIERHPHQKISTRGKINPLSVGSSFNDLKISLDDLDEHDCPPAKRNGTG